MKLSKLLTIAIIGLFTSCANYNPALVRPGARIVVGNTLELLEQQHPELVASAVTSYRALGPVLLALSADPAIPTPGEFKAQLQLQLPPSKMKASTVLDAWSLYEAAYPGMVKVIESHKLPQAYSATLVGLKLGVDDAIEVITTP